MSARSALVGMIYTFIHPIYGNQNHTVQAVPAVQNGTLGQTYQSAPTDVLQIFTARAVAIVRNSTFSTAPIVSAQCIVSDHSPPCRGGRTC